ncbi:hypothetical protein [Pedobacter gandavensis]|uniref:hypothetical protein n=1 Tax=Pedobacter gandavensis TaxID=2679963 RepID=UPI0029312380|nr:hypothetical protein [Pedobacter gandavensis]
MSKLASYIYAAVILTGLLAYIGFTVDSFIIERCQNKYGLSYNAKRKELGIPIIAANWSIKERDEHYIGWSGDETRIGHKRKAVVLSRCSIKHELDVFNLSKQNGNKRWLEMEYFYPQESKGATMIYTYQIDSQVSKVSERTADSLLKADNIQVDIR